MKRRPQGARSQETKVFLAALLGLFLALVPAKADCSKESLARAKAVAYVRLTKLADELRDDGVQHQATFALCGAACGLGDAREVAVILAKDENGKPVFSEPVGRRGVVLLAPGSGGSWSVAGWLAVTDEGKLADEKGGQELELAPGLDADAVVRALEQRLKKAGQQNLERPKPPPTGRNQPWNLMRASPLHRVWPFPF